MVQNLGMEQGREAERADIMRSLDLLFELSAATDVEAIISEAGDQIIRNGSMSPYGEDVSFATHVPGVRWRGWGVHVGSQIEIRKAMDAERGAQFTVTTKLRASAGRARTYIVRPDLEDGITISSRVGHIELRPGFITTQYEHPVASPIADLAQELQITGEAVLDETKESIKRWSEARSYSNRSDLEKLRFLDLLNAAGVVDLDLTDWAPGLWEDELLRQ